MMIELWRKLTPEQRLQKMFRIGKMLNTLVQAELRRHYPDATDREMQLRLAARSYSRELMVKAFGWDPQIHGL